MQDYDSLDDDDIPCRRRMMTICQRQILVESMMMMQVVRKTRRHTIESLVLNEVQYDSTERKDMYATFENIRQKYSCLHGTTYMK